MNYTEYSMIPHPGLLQRHRSVHEMLLKVGSKGYSYNIGCFFLIIVVVHTLWNIWKEEKKHKEIVNPIIPIHIVDILIYNFLLYEIHIYIYMHECRVLYSDLFPLTFPFVTKEFSKLFNNYVVITWINYNLNWCWLLDCFGLWPEKNLFLI